MQKLNAADTKRIVTKLPGVRKHDLCTARNECGCDQESSQQRGSDVLKVTTNASLLGGGGVDGCIHRAAGPCLLAECRTLNGCETGHAKITCGYDLPAKYVIHTVGPIARGHINGSHKEDLANCYQSSLKLVKENNLRSVAFPCISTGIYGFPNEPAAIIALDTIKEWLAKNHQEVDRIIFCVFLEVDFKIYKKKMSEFFPVDDNNEGAADVDMKEDAEGLEPKGLSPPHKKSKAKKPESSKDSSEDESGLEEKPTAGETEGQSQEADGVSTAPVPSPASEGTVEVHQDEGDSAKDDDATKDSDVANHAVCEQELPNGQENDSTKSEVKTETESPSSSMETEELPSNQEDATMVEQPEVIPLTDDDQEEQEGEAQDEDASSVFAKSQGSSDTETTTGPDVEMNSQDDNVNEPTACQQEDFQ
ncbi:ADP-ribose glycohydrolase MACROD2-like [Alexandromys fortis]|uniref:ADP-ribose glycohydrolase MACROD2-like n=1 Tax=Alexandromys fortis TaxID=100897 RepID=UPI002152EBDC|nr:ADP-ribose glycohydrolase MACROD2-like [Microtus fortis]